jgi:hypothetical protein
LVRYTIIIIIIGTTAHFELTPSSEASASRPLNGPAVASFDFVTIFFPEQVVSLTSNPQQSWRTDWIASLSGSSSRTSLAWEALPVAMLPAA